MHHFYSVIIGTELLNGRRVDKHFSFINAELNRRGLKHAGSFVIDDEPIHIQNCFNMILSDPKSVLFSFGGIGATPDDRTREIASEVFTGMPLVMHPEAKVCIEKQFGEEAYPHRVSMAMLPHNAQLLENPVNNVPGFQLYNRFFFTPGFPSMAWPMIEKALNTFFPTQANAFNDVFTVIASENDMIDIMRALPSEIELSSLPRFISDRREVEIYLAHKDEAVLSHWSTFFRAELNKKGIRLKD